MKMEKIWYHFKKMDWIMTGLVVIITLYGLVSIYSSSFFRGDFSNFKKQILFIGLGFLVMIGISLIDWRIFRDDPYLILSLYFLAILALSFLFLLAPTIRGVRGWYKIGPFSLDPIEFAKIILIILLAKYFSTRHTELYHIKHILVSGIYVLIPFVLIALQPDLGSALILLCLWLGILLLSGIKVKHFLVLMILFLIAFFFSWSHFLKSYQQERIISFLAPQIEPLGIGWSQLQSKIAIGSGGFLGRGFRSGSQTQLGFLTAPQTDFIFAAIAEEFGFLGVFVLLFLISALFLRSVKIALRARTNFPRLFSLGFSLLLALQAFIHIGMNLGLLPVIGLSLPFVSYGGSGLIANFIGLGILQSLKVFQEQ